MRKFIALTENFNVILANNAIFLQKVMFTVIKLFKLI